MFQTNTIFIKRVHIQCTIRYFSLNGVRFSVQHFCFDCVLIQTFTIHCISACGDVPSSFARLFGLQLARAISYWVTRAKL